MEQFALNRVLAFVLAALFLTALYLVVKLAAGDASREIFRDFGERLARNLREEEQKK